jgi:ABC-type polysaccharide/polyol phosphate export permease
MMGLSEVWFQLEGAPHFVHQIASFLPLTHLVQAMREIMVDGADIIAVSDHLIVLSVMSAAFLVAGALLFSWQADGR